MSEDLKNVLSKSDDTSSNSESQKTEYVPTDNMSDILNMMDMESKSIVNKSWSKINRSNKITLLENFIERGTKPLGKDEPPWNLAYVDLEAFCECTKKDREKAFKTYEELLA